MQAVAAERVKAVAGIHAIRHATPHVKVTVFLPLVLEVAGTKELNADITLM